MIYECAVASIYTKGEETPEIDPEWPYQLSYIGLDEPKVHAFATAPEEGGVFVKWMGNGEDYIAEPVITLLLDESVDFVAVFEEKACLDHPIMNTIDTYLDIVAPIFCCTRIRDVGSCQECRVMINLHSWLFASQGLQAVKWPELFETCLIPH